MMCVAGSAGYSLRWHFFVVCRAVCSHACIEQVAGSTGSRGMKMKVGDLVMYRPPNNNEAGIIIKIMDVEDSMGGQRFASVLWGDVGMRTENICVLAPLEIKHEVVCKESKREVADLLG